MSQATYSSEGYADADLVARLRAGDEAAVAAPDELPQGTHRGPIRTVERLMRWPVMAYPSISAVRADAVFVSGLQRCDEPSACEVRQAAAAAIRAFGCSGCAGRVAQEFGDHPETAVIRMRWARGVVVEAFADSPPGSGPGADFGGFLVVGRRLPAEQASGSPGTGRREPVRSVAGGDGCMSWATATVARISQRLRAYRMFSIACTAAFIVLSSGDTGTWTARPRRLLACQVGVSGGPGSYWPPQRSAGSRAWPGTRHSSLPCRSRMFIPNGPWCLPSVNRYATQGSLRACVRLSQLDDVDACESTNLLLTSLNDPQGAIEGDPC